jgi:hypothetical protein
MAKEVKEKKIETSESKEEDDEKLKTSNTRKLYIPFYIMVIILLGAVFYIKLANKPLNPIALNLSIIFAILIIIGTEIHKIGNSYEINANSVVHRKGYFSIISKTIEFGAISDADIKQNLWQRIFNFGHVEIHRYSEFNKTIIKDINNPAKFQAFLQKKMIAKGGRKR